MRQIIYWVPAALYIASYPLAMEWLMHHEPSVRNMYVAILYLIGWGCCIGFALIKPLGMGQLLAKVWAKGGGGQNNEALSQCKVKAIARHIDKELRDAGLQKAAGEAGIYSDFIIRETLAYLSESK